MRYINIIFIALLLILVSCSASQEQLTPKSTSTPITVGVTGEVSWTIMSPPDLTIHVWNYNGIEWEETTYDATAAPPDYEEFISLSTTGTFRFYPEQPNGYDVTPEYIQKTGVSDQMTLEDLDFTVSEE